MSFQIPKATAVTVVFKAFLASDHVTEATGKTIAITISKAGGAFGNPNAGATNATEISSGWYKVALDTTDTGTNGHLAVRGAVATIDDVGILYQVVNATNGGLTALPDTAVSTNASLITSGTGTAQLSVASGQAQADVAKIATAAVSTTSAQIGVNVVQISTDATAADNAESFFDGTGYAGTNNVIPSVTTVTGNVNGNVGGNVTGSIGSLATQAKADVNAEVVDTLATDTYAEPGQGNPAATASLSAKINYLYKSWRNKKTQTATTLSIFADDAATVDHKSTVSDDGTTLTEGEIATGP